MAFFVGFASLQSWIWATSEPNHVGTYHMDSDGLE